MKALEAIETLAQADNGLSLSELAERTGYPVSTSHRLLATLVERGYVEQDSQTRRYYLGIKILTLQAQGIRRRHLGRFAFPHLNRLKQQLNGTINLGVLRVCENILWCRDGRKGKYGDWRVGRLR